MSEMRIYGREVEIMKEIAEKAKEFYENKEYGKVIEITNPYIKSANYENDGMQILMYSSLCLFINGFYNKKTDIIEIASKSIKTTCLMFPNYEEMKEYMLTFQEKIADAYYNVVLGLLGDAAEKIDMPDCKMAIIMSESNTYYAQYKLFSNGVLTDVINTKKFNVSKAEIKATEKAIELIDTKIKLKIANAVVLEVADIWEGIKNEYDNNHLSPNKAITLPLAQKVLFGATQIRLAIKNALFLNEDETDIDTKITSNELESLKIQKMLQIISESLGMYLVNGKKVFIFFDDSSKLIRSIFISEFDKYAALLKKLSPEAEIPDRPEEHPITQISSGGCYVATAVYGSYDCPQVWTLRRYRDNTLASAWYGRAFIHTYYAISPTIVKWFGNTNWFKNMWKGKLDRMVANLQSNGVEDTPYEDKKW